MDIQVPTTNTRSETEGFLNAHHSNTLRLHIGTAKTKKLMQNSKKNSKKQNRKRKNGKKKLSALNEELSTKMQKNMMMTLKTHRVNQFRLRLFSLKPRCLKPMWLKSRRLQ